MKNEPDIKNILEEFPGVTIHSITRIGETTDEEQNLKEVNIIEE